MAESVNNNSEEKIIKPEQSEEVVGYKDGEVIEGTVTGITSFGAFVKLPDGSEGLVHISEVADTYVTNVENFLTLNETVTIKNLGKNKKGKYDLSIKQAPGYQKKESSPSEEKAMMASAYSPQKKRDKNFEAGSFDDLMDNFLKKSDEIQLDVRRNMQYKQGVKKKGMKAKKKLNP